MSVKIYKPGERKGNKTCIYRFKIFGRVVEKVTDTTNPAVARRLGVAAEARLRASDEKNITFAEAADLYRAFAKLQPDEVKRLAKVMGVIGGKMVRQIT